MRWGRRLELHNIYLRVEFPSCGFLNNKYFAEFDCTGMILF